MTELSSTLMELAKSVDPCSEEDSRRIAERAIARVKTAELRELAIRELDSWIQHYRRQKARTIERETERVRRVDHQEQLRQQIFKALLTDPVTAYAKGGTLTNTRERAAFKKWAGAAFAEWYERGRSGIAEQGDRRNLDLFLSDWHPDGPDAYFRGKRIDQTMQLIQQVAEETRLQVTEELLSTYFALGDGKSVTWGSATIDQHEQRLSLLSAHAAGVVDTAVRHQAAIRMIREAGGTCLNDVSSRQVKAVA